MKQSTGSPSVGSSMGGMFVLRLLSQFVTLLTIIIISRVLGPEEFGRYSFLFALLLVVSLFNVSGINSILVREMASKPERADIILRNGMMLNILTGVFAFILSCLIFNSFNIIDLPVWIVCIASLTLFFSFSMNSTRLVLVVPYQVNFRMTAASLVNFIAKLLLLVLVLIWSIKGNSKLSFDLFQADIDVIKLSVITVIILQISSEMIGSILQGSLNLKFGFPLIPRWNTEIIKYLVKEVWPVAISGALGMIFTRSPFLFLRYFRTEYDVGISSVPMRLVEALTIIATVFVTAALPIMSRLFIKDHQKFLDFVRLCYKTMFILVFPIVTVVMIYSRDIMVFLSGEAYVDSAPVLSLLIWAAVLYFSSAIFAAVLVAAGKQKILMYLYGVQVIFSIILSLLLIPRFGCIGAALSTIITNILLFPLALFIKSIRYAGAYWLRTVFTPVILAAIVSLFLRFTDLNLWLAIGLTPILFYGSGLIVRWLKRDDLVRILDIFSSHKVNE